MEKKDRFILWFDEIGIEDVSLVGGKNASLGEMYRFLKGKVPVPNGFAITATAYNFFIERTKLKDKIAETLKRLNTKNMNSLADKGHRIRSMIRNAEIPYELRTEIIASYERLCKEYGPNADVAVRSSATAEDLPDASFAGQQESYLNIRGADDLIDACLKCFSSLFTNRAISYRADKKFDQFSIALSIVVQKMVRSDKACSGVMFTIDTESGFRDAVVINAGYGLGENIVKGFINPDQYIVFKPTLKQGFKPLISKKLGAKEMRLVYTVEGNAFTKNSSVPQEEREKFCLLDSEILTLAKWGCEIEDYYTAKKGHSVPMDIEWAKDGVSGKLCIVQARPETVVSRRDPNIIHRYVLKKRGRVIVKGASVGDRIGSGSANVIKSVHEIGKFKPGQVLVTEMTDPDWEPIMKMASAIVTNKGGRTCHAAIVSRELGIPCVVGTIDATKKIADRQPVTVSCAEGEVGYVYSGILKYSVMDINLKELPRPRTKIMMNIGNPDEAFSLSFIPNDGVGLAREEFIISSYIKVHPKALLDFKNIKDKAVKEEIEKLTQGYPDKKMFFIDKLAQGIAMIAAAFYPKDVIVRLSDFKTNEYAGLLGGSEFEPKEGNPMLGWRGASRYYDEKYKAAFALECKALVKVRREYGLTNVKVMVPFCRTVEEGQKVLEEMRKNGLERGRDNLQVYVMCEIPSNVILADEFCKIFDGFSIGSNDLTQLTLGVDRDSELVSRIYDEKNPAVKRLIESVIRTARQFNRKAGICGQAPSDFPEFAEFLVDCGIDSISLNPDTIIKTTVRIAEKEKNVSKLLMPHKI
ncbi:phosphoenolpyruvate synthase [Candidatus Woesearchaeota archaeon CG10_big_fil_rev_8_21_14_0_10_45_5]|nr:MAG: phosphoenolpyruvate synthase [Candidatus Woesearchaeota archaeon CG10_big_fil_rev_8_21_14_0_10_45_5]PIU29613.1 MAG: phosphoenolpyruvate synthase [Candidatus Woesearchaeota archaeon CG07_land_8_20_14_0_80_44_23]